MIITTMIRIHSCNYRTIILYKRDLQRFAKICIVDLQRYA